MWEWIMSLDPLVQWGALLVAGGLVMVAGVWAVERGFRREWELPAEPESWAYRVSTGELPTVQPAPIRDQGMRSLAEDWRAGLNAGLRPAGRHRFANIGEETRPISVARLNRRWAEPDPEVVDALRRALGRDQPDQL